MATGVMSGTLSPRRRVLVAAGAVGVVALGALAGVVTVNGEHGKGSKIAATLPFADESYSTGALVVSRTWSLSSAGDQLRGVVTIKRTAAGGPAAVPEWLPSQLSSSEIKASGGATARTQDGSAVLQLRAPSASGSTSTYRYEVATNPGPATLARLQGWAVQQSVQATDLRADLGEQAPDTVNALAVGNPAVALTARGATYPLGLRGGDTAGRVAAAMALSRTSYSSDDPSVADVDAHGVVQPHHPGTTLITARLGPLAASATVLVTDPRSKVPLQFVSFPDGRFVVDTRPSHPAAPSKVTATPGNGSALVVWSAPDNGGYGITGYDVYADGKLVKRGVSGTHLLITGLLRGHAYRFTVVAHNQLGKSVASPASAPVVPRTGLPSKPSGCTPAAPSRLSAALVGRTTVRVTWVAPATQPGCSVSAVKIQAYPPTRSVVAAPGATSVDIPGLDSTTQYAFAVTAAYGSVPAQTSARSAPVVTIAGACWDGSYSDPCPSQPVGVQGVATPIMYQAAPVTAAAAPVDLTTPVPVVTTSSLPTSSVPGLSTPVVSSSPPPQVTGPPQTATVPTPPTDTSSTPPPNTTSPAPQQSTTPPTPAASSTPPPSDPSVPSDGSSTGSDTTAPSDGGSTDVGSPPPS